MKKITSIVLAAITTANLMFLPSCTEGFEEINENPNQSPSVLAETLLAPAITRVVEVNMNRNKRINNELMQVHVSHNETEGIHRYVIRPSEADYLWNNWYLQLTNFKDMYALGEGTANKTLMGISLICQTWVYSLLTDTFGDVPYTAANRGREGILQPSFDKQEDIYADFFRSLEEANTLLAENKDLTSDQAQRDPIFQGDALLWRKFGNSLYLRLLLRASNKSEAIAGGKTAPEKIHEMLDERPADYPIMASNAESAVLRWTGTDPYRSPFQDLRSADFTLGISLSEFFINNLVEWGDPRITKWASTTEGQYIGMESGYAERETPQPVSTYLGDLKTEPLLGNILNYSEVQFILAEAAVKGWTSGSAKTYYENGVTNGITNWGLTVPANYLQSTGIIWDDAFTTETKMEQIHLQKYYALYFTDFQQWFEHRRTGLPNLPEGPGLHNNGMMPARLNYPVYVQSLNRESYLEAVASQGPDDINTKVWWQE